MKTAIISFSGGNSYIKDRQIGQILKEDDVVYLHECKDYDELDLVAPILREFNIQKIVVLHEEYNIDRFEQAARIEYGRLFEKIEVIPDFSKLRENEGAAASTNTEEKPKKVIQHVVIVPFNAPVKGTFEASPQFENIISSNGLDYRTNTLLASLVLKQGDSSFEGFWNRNPLYIAGFLGGNHGEAPNSMISGGAELENILQQKEAVNLQNVTLHIPGRLKDKLNLKYITKTVPLQNMDTDAGICNEALALGKQIIDDVMPLINEKDLKKIEEKIKIDDNKVSEWKGTDKMKMVTALLEDVQTFYAIKPGEHVPAEKNNGKGDWRKAFLQNIGAADDAKSIANSLENMGVPVSFFAAVGKAVGDAAKDLKNKNKEEEIDGEALYICHPSFDDFVSKFDVDKVQKKERV